MMDYKVKCHHCGRVMNALTKNKALAARSFHVRSNPCDWGLENSTNVVIYKLVGDKWIPSMKSVDKLFSYTEIDSCAI